MSNQEGLAIIEIMHGEITEQSEKLEFKHLLPWAA